VCRRDSRRADVTLVVAVVLLCCCCCVFAQPGLLYCTVILHCYIALLHCTVVAVVLSGTGTKQMQHKGRRGAAKARGIITTMSMHVAILRVDNPSRYKELARTRCSLLKCNLYLYLELYTNRQKHSHAHKHTQPCKHTHSHAHTPGQAVTQTVFPLTWALPLPPHACSSLPLIPLPLCNRVDRLRFLRNTALG